MQKRKKSKLSNHLLIFALVSVNFTIISALAYANFTTTKTPTLETSAIVSVNSSLDYTPSVSDALATHHDMLDKTLESTLSDQRIHEPKAIITHKKNSSAKARRHNMSDRLGLVRIRLRELKDNQGLETELAKINNYLENLRQEHGITSDIDPRSLMGPLERSKLDRQYAELRRQKHQGKVRNMKQKIVKKAHKYRTQMTQMKQNFAAKKRRS